MGQFHEQELNIINEKDVLQFLWVFCINEYGNRKMILPVAKLGALLMKSLGKPLAIRLKTHAAKHPRFRQFIIDVAQVRVLLMLINFIFSIIKILKLHRSHYCVDSNCKLKILYSILYNTINIKNYVLLANSNL